MDRKNLNMNVRDPRSTGMAADGPGISRSVATRRPQHRERSASGHLAGQQASSTAATRLPRPMRPQEGSRSNSSSALNGGRPPAHAAAINSRPGRSERPRDPVSNPSRRPASAALTGSRPKGPVQSAEESRAVRIAALGHSAGNRAYACAAAGVLSPYRRRISGAILEENGEAEERSSTLSPLSSRTRSENVRWSDPGPLRAPGHARAPTIHSQYGSIVAASGATTRRSLSAPTTVPLLPTVLPAAAQAQASTYMDMHHVYERAPACKPYVPLMDFGANYSQNSDGTTLRHIQRRAEAMRAKFPIPANAAASARRGRQFAGQAFVDAPGTVGNGPAPLVVAARERALPVEGAQRNLNGEIQGTRTVHWGSTASSPARDEDEAPEEEKKGKWKRFSGFVARKLGKGKRSSSSDPSSDSSRTSSARPQSSIAIPEEVPAPVSPISAETWAQLEGRDRDLDHFRRVSSLSSSELNGIYDGAAEDDKKDDDDDHDDDDEEPAAEPAPAPAAPAPAAPVPGQVPAAPTPEQSAPYPTAAAQHSGEADMMSLFSAAQIQAPYQGHELMEFEEDDVSALRESDPDAFPSALNEQARWARPQAPAPLSAEEMVEALEDGAGWSGVRSEHREEAGEEAQSLEALQAVDKGKGKGKAKLVDVDEEPAEIREAQQAIYKGKGKLVDVPKSRIPKRYRRRQQQTACALVSEGKDQMANEGEADGKPKKAEGSLASDADADAKSWKTADLLNTKGPMLVVSAFLPHTTGSQRDG